MKQETKAATPSPSKSKLSEVEEKIRQSHSNLASPSIPETGNGICKQCGKTYNRKEVARVYGKESAVLAGGFCTHQCYTKYQTAPSIPVKEELLDITKGEWEAKDIQNNIYVITEDADICMMLGKTSLLKNERLLSNAKAICTAVNNTYGKGFDPSKMEGIYLALKALVKVMDEYHGQMPVAFRAERMTAKIAIENAKTIKP